MSFIKREHTVRRQIFTLLICPFAWMVPQQAVAQRATGYDNPLLHYGDRSLSGDPRALGAQVVSAAAAVLAVRLATRAILQLRPRPLRALHRGFLGRLAVLRRVRQLHHAGLAGVRLDRRLPRRQRQHHHQKSALSLVVQQPARIIEPFWAVLLGPNGGRRHPHNFDSPDVFQAALRRHSVGPYNRQVRPDHAVVAGQQHRRNFLQRSWRWRPSQYLHRSDGGEGTDAGRRFCRPRRDPLSMRRIATPTCRLATTRSAACSAVR